ncbi:6-O-methylguanine DNA methyltransferase [Psychromonas sp. psych-6C06]|uniref:methylated-DNA--[protein]-cysteine S-methyltransferase n=1 Tax=Psychromonas sp. psych-6C06 TaxID=2058089 RepID=UPI000C32A825|nr:methylated-DNA--[protein]-cysteine S-methyltransferase [Psychromonas sp. psych-6C06]PKF61407.1 6-O-methylguanine DNA methyltransferase [Psychromonas sp. psych-6C06]
MSKQDNQRHYQLIEQAIYFIRAQQAKQPSLKEVADAVGVSELHFQRLFSQWAGISPKRFLQYLTKEAALKALQESSNLLEASLSAGLSGTGRLHDLMVSCEAMTPGEIKLAGKGMVIDYAFVDTPFGEALLAWTARGICYLQFVGQSMQLVDDLQKQWPNAKYRLNQDNGAQLALDIFSSAVPKQQLHLLIKGTNFQIKVWEAVLHSAVGQQLSYAQLAKGMGNPKASRAVGSALASNNIAYLIPCHRVIKSTGELSHYRWGGSRKAAMQVWEKAHNVAT